MQGRVLVGCALAAVLLTAGCSGGAPRNDAGQVTASATADAFEIKVGDCMGSLSDSGSSPVPLVPCNQAHYWEAYASIKMTGDTYPGETAITTQAEKDCGTAFKAFVGVAPSDSDYSLTYYYPSQDSWEKGGDREILCIAGSASGGIKGSLKGVKK